MQRNPLKLALYISFFPQLVAGPIVRYTTVADEIDKRHESVSEFSAGAVRFLFGLAKKMLLANAVAQIADAAFSAVSPSVALAWLGAVAYTFQIYFDFPPIPTWPPALAGCSASTFLKTSTIPMSPAASRVLAALAHLALHVVPRLCLHSPRRQPLLPRAQYSEPLSRLGAHRPLAWGQLDVHRVGPVVLCAAHRRKVSLG